MKKTHLIFSILLLFSVSSSAQFGKLKGMMGGKKDTSAKVADTTDKKKERSGGSFFSKAVIKIAKLSSGLVAEAGGLMLKTDDLNAVVPMAGTSSNLVPAALGTADMSFMNGWLSGGACYTIFMSQKDKVGWAKVIGNITINGKPADFVSTGLYVAFEKDKTKPAKVEIVTASGQKSSFTMNTSKYQVKILSINGQTGDNIGLDLTKDVVVELEHTPGAENIQLNPKIAITIFGFKTLIDLGYFKGTDKLVIPAAAFRNVNIGPGSTPLMTYKGSFLSITRMESKITEQVSGVYPPFTYYTTTQDGRYINVTTEPVLNKGITVKGTEKLPNGAVDYNFFKAHAFVSRPFEHIKKLGVASFSIRGTTYKDGKTSKSESSYTIGNTKYTTTTTTHTWAQFPNVSKSVWAEALASLYADFTSAAQKELNATLLPIEQITETAAYQHISEYSKDDETTDVSFSHSYKNGKLISAMIPLSEGYGENSAETKIMKESGANALMKFTFDLQIAIESGRPVMVPKLGFQIGGENNGLYFPTKYCSATISGKGVGFPKQITAVDIARIVRQSDLLQVFVKGLRELKKAEMANGDYKLLWDMQ